MEMYNPPHPGEFIQETYMNPFGLSCGYLAEKLDIATSTLHRILQQIGINPEIALRLSKALGRSPQSWLAIQDAYDLWQIQNTVELSRVQRIELNII